MKRIRPPSLLLHLSNGITALRNRLRRRHKHLDYILLNLPSTLPSLPEHRSWLRQRLQGSAPLSLTQLDRIFRQIGDDPRPRGVILHVGALAMSLADLQTLRASIQRLRAKGKRVIASAPMYTIGPYYVASGCDAILLQPGGELMTVGLRDETVFLKDALDTLGITLDVVAISPYKGAFDRFTRGDISPEGRAQLEWLLDSRYQILVDGIAEGRKTNADAVRAMIDAAPHLDDRALAAGYVDAVLNEEGLPAYLGAKHLIPWANAQKRLLLKPRKAAERCVALLPVSGMMMLGESARPPANLPIPIPFVGGARAGDRTVVRQARNLMKRKNVAAVILYIDSPGGLALAAEAMTSALDELGKTRPLVVYMNAVAASGGYYIATAGHWIVAQPGTITGSIGVVTAKPVTGALMDRLRVHTVEFTRGANASFYSEQTPFTPAQREQVRASIENIYRRFLERVARSRKLSVEAVDAVGGGRVWTGAQAQALGLVDELGDLQAALVRARALAHLPDDAPLMMLGGKLRPLPPQLAEVASPTAMLRYLHENARGLFGATAQMVLPVWWNDKL